MYACLHVEDKDAALSLLELVQKFSPVFEQAGIATVVFSIDPLRKLIGSPHQIAAAISLAGYEQKLQARLAIASNPDSAILLATSFPGVTLVTPGEENLKLGTISLAALLAQVPMVNSALLNVLHRWGLKNCGDLAALPEKGVAERLGKEGVHLRNLACGLVNRPLRTPASLTNYENHVDLEHSLELLEPLLFLLGRALQELCAHLRSQGRAARQIIVELNLAESKLYRFELEFPVPLEDSRTILKLLQLHLEKHSPQAPITAFTLRVEPAEPRRTQGGIFLPPAPLADKLQVTLARISGMVGKENVGTPILLNSHRPDAFEMTKLPYIEASDSHEALAKPQLKSRETLRLAVRLFRPALPARVRLKEYVPKDIMASGVKGKVMRYAGPWKTSGEWWTATFWCREEWDVGLDDGALYRIYQDSQSGAWYVYGVYD